MAPTSTRAGDPEARRASPSTRSSARARRDRALLACIGVGVMVAYVAFERNTIDIWDGKAMASVAQNLLQHHSLKECCRAYGAFPRDPGPYAKFGIGFSLMLAPLWHFQLVSNPNGALWLGLANPLLLAATTVVIAKTGLLLGWRRSTAVLTALAFAFFTMAPLYSTEFFADPGVTFGASLLMLGFVVWQEKAPAGALLIGLGTAVAILFRPDSIILFGPVVPLMLLFRSRHDLLTTWRSWIAWLGIPIAAAVSWTLFYDSLRYGNPFQVGYSGAYDSRGFDTPLMTGVHMLLWSPGKSFFLFSPILIAAIPGMYLLARRRAPLAIAIGVMFVVRVAFYARWWTPEGGNSWGPRFLLPLCAVLAIPLGEAIEHVHVLRQNARRAALCGFAFLAAASTVVVFSSLVVSYRDLFFAMGSVKTFPPSIQHAVVDHRQYQYLWTWGGNQILWNLQHIGGALDPSPLFWLRHGHRALGVLMLAVAAVMCAAAIGLALVSDRIDEQRFASRGSTDSRRVVTTANVGSRRPSVPIDLAGDT